jgi:hypothetical protein
MNTFLNSTQCFIRCPYFQAETPVHIYEDEFYYVIIACHIAIQMRKKIV